MHPYRDGTGAPDWRNRAKAIHAGRSGKHFVSERQATGGEGLKWERSVGRTSWAPLIDNDSLLRPGDGRARAGEGDEEGGGIGIVAGKAEGCGARAAAAGNELHGEAGAGATGEAGEHAATNDAEVGGLRSGEGDGADFEQRARRLIDQGERA